MTIGNDLPFGPQVLKSNGELEVLTDLFERVAANKRCACPSLTDAHIERYFFPFSSAYWYNLAAGTDPTKPGMLPAECDLVALNLSAPADTAFRFELPSSCSEDACDIKVSIALSAVRHLAVVVVVIVAVVVVPFL